MTKEAQDSKATQKDKFDAIVDLVTHIVEELVDDPDSLEINASHTGNTGSIEICGPEHEVGKIYGSRRKNMMSIDQLAFSVASKYGFKVLINVLNTAEAKVYRHGAQQSNVQE